MTETLQITVLDYCNAIVLNSMFCLNCICVLACSKRSDSGERCEEKKAMESRGVPFYFAPLPTIWTPGTGYLCTDTVISLYRGRFYARCAKNSSLYREYRYIEDRYIGVLSHIFYCNFCRVIAYLSLYRGYRYIEDRCIGVPLYYLIGVTIKFPERERV